MLIQPLGRPAYARRVLAAASDPAVPSPDAVTLSGAPAPSSRELSHVGMATALQAAGVSFTYEERFLTNQWRHADPERVVQRLGEGRSVEAGTPRGYSALYDLQDLAALSDLSTRPPATELARLLVDFERRGWRLHDNPIPDRGLIDTYRGLTEGKAAMLRPKGEAAGLVVRSLEEVRVVAYLYDLGVGEDQLEKPEVARSLKLLCEHTLSAGAPAAALRLYAHGGLLELDQLTFTPEELADPSRVGVRLAPLRALKAALPRAQVELAHSAVHRIPCERSMDERLEAAGFAFSFPGAVQGHHDLYRALVDGDGPVRDRVQLAERVRAALPPGSEPWLCRDALLLAPGHRQKEYLRLLELSASPNWAKKTLDKLADVSPERLEKAAWDRISWRHITSRWLIRRPLGKETREQRERAFARIYADCRCSMAAATALWKQLRTVGDFEDAMSAHARLRPVLAGVNPRGLGWWEAECMRALRAEQQGGVFQGRSLSECVDALAPLLRDGALHSAREPHEIVTTALAQLKAVSGRTGVEERSGSVIVGGVRLPRH